MARELIQPFDRLHDPDRGLVYPGEAASILGLTEHCSYRQLQAIWFLGRRSQRLLPWTKAESAARLRDVYPEPDERNRHWTRFSVVDLACARAIVRLFDGPEAFGPGRRPRLAPIARACQALQGAGVDNPLLDLELRRSGDRVMVRVNQVVIDATTGQAILSEALADVMRRVGRADQRLVDAARSQARRGSPPAAGIGTKQLELFAPLPRAGKPDGLDQ